jgi:hypothetical protein
MLSDVKDPASAAAPTGSEDIDLQHSDRSSETRESAPKTQDISRDLLREDLTCNISAMIATLEAALAMHAADDDVGLIYGLRRAKAYWRCISASAAEFSALRQGGSAP